MRIAALRQAIYHATAPHIDRRRCYFTEEIVQQIELVGICAIENFLTVTH